MRDVITIFLFFGFTTLFAQKPLNYKDYHQKFKSLIFKNPDSALQYVYKIKSEKDKSQSFFPSYYYHQDIGQYFFFVGQLDSSEHHYKKAYLLSTSERIDSLSIDSNIWLANHEYFKGEMKKSHLRYKTIFKDSEKAKYLEGITTSYSMFASIEPDLSKKMNLYLKIDSLYKSNNNQSSLLARVNASIAEIYLEAKGNNKLAESYIKKCIEISKKVNYPPGEYEANRLLIKLALQENKFDKAIQLYKKLLKQGTINGDPTAIDVATIGLVKIYISKNEFKKAEENLIKLDYLLKKTEGSPLIGVVYLHWAELFIELGNPKKALLHLNKAKLNPDLTDKLGFNTELKRIEIKYFEYIKDFAKAYQLKIAYDEQIELINQQQNTNGFILEEQLKFEAQKQQEVALLKTQYELAETKRKAQRNLLLGGVFISSLTGLLLFIMYKNRIKSNRKLREIDTLKTNFFTNISHEFRTPLTLISAPLQETLGNQNLSTKQRKHFEIAYKNTERLSSLVNQLLELSKIESGNRTLLIQHNKPSQMIAAWCESFIYLAKQKNIDFTTQITNKNVLGWFDSDALENIIINLLGNAVKYTPNEGYINLSVSIQNKILQIKIKNSGQGLTCAQINTIFNRFYQTDNHNEGTGIGLSLVKVLTELHGGKIKATSEVNKWTFFEVSLCLDKNSLKNIVVVETPNFQNATTTKAIEKEAQHKETYILNNEPPILLIVEDNTDLRILLSNTFKEEYVVIEAVNGEHGISIALDKIPDIIISDVMMPKKNGIELTKTLKKDERTSHIPIILLTAKVGDENELTGIDVGADDYITKPFNQKILKSKTASLINLRKKLHSRYSQEIILRPKDIAITSTDEKFLNKVQKILNNNLVDPSFSTVDFSKAAHMSRMQLHRKLKALTGLSSTEFIRSQRLKLAAQILKRADINISEVGYNVGFNNHAYFSKCFKEVYHCTPSEYVAIQKAT